MCMGVSKCCETGWGMCMGVSKCCEMRWVVYGSFKLL